MTIIKRADYYIYMRRDLQRWVMSSKIGRYVHAKEVEYFITYDYVNGLVIYLDRASPFYTNKYFNDSNFYANGLALIKKLCYVVKEMAVAWKIYEFQLDVSIRLRDKAFTRTMHIHPDF